MEHLWFQVHQVGQVTQLPNPAEQQRGFGDILSVSAGLFSRAQTVLLVLTFPSELTFLHCSSDIEENKEEKWPQDDRKNNFSGNLKKTGRFKDDTVITFMTRIPSIQMEKMEGDGVRWKSSAAEQRLPEVCACNDNKRILSERKGEFYKKTNPPRAVGFMQYLLHFSLARLRGSFLSLTVLLLNKSKLPTRSKLWIFKWNSESNDQFRLKRNTIATLCRCDAVNE